jgi:hypothetical protein
MPPLEQCLVEGKIGIISELIINILDKIFP